ncbi:MAG: alkaline phosphatase family protein [Proteobacteria bacterium]|nr:alkaline phosphatase family protein [Pseudomonadota bacterium]
MVQIEPTQRRKVLLIGWDAADWKVIHPLMDAGKMPALQRLVETGVSGNLASLDPPMSPIMWTSIGTGMTADKHGVLGFTQPRADGKGVQPVLASSRKVKALWNILMQCGLTTHVIGWWPSHPAEKLDGVSISNFYHRVHGSVDRPSPMPPGSVHPERLQAILEELRIHPQELTGQHILPFVGLAETIDQTEDNRLATIARITAECSTVQAAATWVMRNEPWDFMAVYFDAIDHYCHGFMKFHPPCREGIPKELYDRYKGVVEGGYRLHDMMLARLLELAGPETTVVLCSDHGFHPDHLRPMKLPNEPAGPAAEHRHYGIVVLNGPGIKEDELVYGASLLDITPTILSLYGLPVGEDMDGKALVGAFSKAQKPAFIPSWEEVAGASGGYTDSELTDPWAEQAAMEQLIELGYIEKPDDDAEKAIASCQRESKYFLARTYIHKSRYDKAVPLLEELFAEQPDQARFGLRLAHAYLQLEKIAESRRITDATLVAWEERTLEQHRKLVEKVRQEKGDDALAPLTLEELRQRHQPTLDLLQGSLLFAEGKDGEAITCLLRAQEADRRLPDLHNQLGRLYLKMQRFQDAEEAWFQALEIDPDSAQAYHGLAQVYLRSGHFREASEAASASLGLLFHNPSAHLHLGEARFRLGDFEGAEQSWLNAVGQAPGMRAVHKRLLTLYQRHLHDPVKALRHRQCLDDRIVAFDEFKKRQGTPPLDATTPVRRTEGSFLRKFDLDASQVVTIVSGLPRSGTSMMMQMLAGGGLSLLTDGGRLADEHNPRGYFELEEVKGLGGTDGGWLEAARGKAVKIIAQLIENLPRSLFYRIIFMERNLEEILQSQARMLGERASMAESLAATYQQQLQRTVSFIEGQANMELLHISHQQTIARPALVAGYLHDFLAVNFDINAAAATVIPELHRVRAGAPDTVSEGEYYVPQR